MCEQLATGVPSLAALTGPPPAVSGDCIQTPTTDTAAATASSSAPFAKITTILHGRLGQTITHPLTTCRDYVIARQGRPARRTGVHGHGHIHNNNNTVFI